MSRIKCRYVAQLIVDIDTPYSEPDYRPIAEVRERFRTMLTPMLYKEIQQKMGKDAVVNLVEQLVNVYEVTE